jgi:hypothetical protein
MKKQKILKISNVKYTGFLYNLELISSEPKEDLYWVEQNSKIVSHNCLYKDLHSLMNFGKHTLNLDMNMLEAADQVNERVREKKDWLEIKGATTENNYCE